MTQPRQLPLFSPERERPFNTPFPATRYQGSKRALVDWIWEHVADLPFDTVLDVFGGTGAVSHMFKNAGKQVTYNDSLAFNHQIGLALIENPDVRLSEADVETILAPRTNHPTLIQDTFSGVYFTDAENSWLDRVIHNIDKRLADPFKMALARFALFQACIIKRPYNLFHRANLYMRTADVRRSFGNKTTWDTPFETHFRAFIEQANHAVFDNHRCNQATNRDAFDTPIGADLVYLDPPYLNQKGTGVDYRNFYHFLEGMVDYAAWADQIDYRSKHRRLKPEQSVWTNASTIAAAFDRVIERHRDSILVVSYRDDGIPTKDRIKDILLRYKSQVHEAAQPKQYVLSNKRTQEVLLVA